MHLDYAVFKCEMPLILKGAIWLCIDFKLTLHKYRHNLIHTFISIIHIWVSWVRIWVPHKTYVFALPSLKTSYFLCVRCACVITSTYTLTSHTYDIEQTLLANSLSPRSHTHKLNTAPRLKIYERYNDFKTDQTKQSYFSIKTWMIWFIGKSLLFGCSNPIIYHTSRVAWFSGLRSISLRMELPRVCDNSETSI